MHQYRRLIWLTLFLLTLFLMFELSGLRDHFNLTYIRQTIQHHQVMGLVFFVLLFCLGNLIHLPGWIFLAAAVLALGELMGGLATYIAATISCASTFLVVHLLGGDALAQLNSKFAVKVLEKLHNHPVRSVVILRTVLQTLPTLNYALALSGVKFRQYMIGTMLGLPLPILLYCIFFDRLVKIFNIT